jgi:hypothetical protein
MGTLPSLVVSSFQAIGAPECPTYEAILEHAVATAPPPFAINSFGRRYFQLATQADWFANSLVANAALEGYGAQQIWKFSNRIANDSYAQAVRKHALDESRHSTIFVAMLNMVFPGAVIDQQTEDELQAMQPRFALKAPPIVKSSDAELCEGEVLLNELIQVHITEIRALVLQHLLRSMLLAYAKPPYEHRLERMSSQLIRDEARHIEYTARIFEREAQSGAREFLFDTFTERLRNFNHLTLIELEREEVVL